MTKLEEYLIEKADFESLPLAKMEELLFDSCPEDKWYFEFWQAGKEKKEELLRDRKIAELSYASGFRRLRRRSDYNALQALIDQPPKLVNPNFPIVPPLWE